MEIKTTSWKGSDFRFLGSLDNKQFWFLPLMSQCKNLSPEAKPVEKHWTNIQRHWRTVLTGVNLNGMHKICGRHSPVSYVSQRLSLTKGSGSTWEWKHVCVFVICPMTQTASDVAKSTLAGRAKRAGHAEKHVGFDWPWRVCAHWLNHRFDDSVDVSKVRTEESWFTECFWENFHKVSWNHQFQHKMVLTSILKNNKLFLLQPYATYTRKKTYKFVIGLVS